MKNVYTVKQVNAYIKNMFIQDFMLNRICVKGRYCLIFRLNIFPVLVCRIFKQLKIIPQALKHVLRVVKFNLEKHFKNMLPQFTSYHIVSLLFSLFPAGLPSAYMPDTAAEAGAGAYRKRMSFDILCRSKALCHAERISLVSPSQRLQP